MTRCLLPLLAVAGVLSVASCSSTTSPSTASPTTPVAVPAPRSPADVRPGADTYQFQYAEGYPQLEAGPDGRPTGRVLVLLQASFTPPYKGSQFTVTSNPSAGGLMTNPLTLDEAGGVVGRLDSPSGKVVPAVLVVPAGRQDINPTFILQVPGPDGLPVTAIHGLPTTRIDVPAASAPITPATGRATPTTRK